MSFTFTYLPPVFVNFCILIKLLIVSVGRPKGSWCSPPPTSLRSTRASAPSSCPRELPACRWERRRTSWASGLRPRATSSLKTVSFQVNILHVILRVIDSFAEIMSLVKDQYIGRIIFLFMLNSDNILCLKFSVLS